MTNEFYHSYKYNIKARKEGRLDTVDKWRSEARNYAGFSFDFSPKQNEKYANVKEALQAVESKQATIILPFIETINEIVKSYMSILDMMEEGVNIPNYKLFGNFQMIFAFECFKEWNYISNFYKPAIVLFPENKGNNLFELELSHNFDKYQLVDLLASDFYVNMSVYCCEKLVASIDSNFEGLVIDVTDPYKRVFVKFWTKAKKITLVLKRFR